MSPFTLKAVFILTVLMLNEVSFTEAAWMDDSVCIANCDFSKRTLCNYHPAYLAQSFSLKYWNSTGKHSVDTGDKWEQFYYYEMAIMTNNDVNYYTYGANGIHVRRHLEWNVNKETKIRFTVRLSSPNIQLEVAVASNVVTKLLQLNSTRKGWQTLTATLPVKIHQLIIHVANNGKIPNNNVEYFGMRKIEVEADC